MFEASCSVSLSAKLAEEFGLLVSTQSMMRAMRADQRKNQKNKHFYLGSPHTSAFGPLAACEIPSTCLGQLF